MEVLDNFAWDDTTVAAEAKRRFDAHWEDPSALPSEYKVSFRFASCYALISNDLMVLDDGISRCADEWRNF